MLPPLVRARLGSALRQDLDAVWREWALEVERPDPSAFVEHLVAWRLIDAATASQALRLLDAPLVGSLDDISEDLEEQAATLHYASWTERDDPDGETRLASPQLGWDDTSEEPVSEEAPLPAPATAEDPIGRFRFLDPHRAEDRALSRVVAFGELRREARLVAQLEHAGIAPVYELLSDDRVTRRLPQGPTLRERLDDRRGGTRALLDVVIRVAETVAYAHARGVAHGHLGPEVVHVGEFGEVLVSGWGEAHVFDRSVPRPVVLEGGPGRLERPDDDLRAIGRMLREVAGADGPADLRAIAEGAVRYDNAASLVADLERARVGEAVAIAPDSAIRAAARALAQHPEHTLWLLVGLSLATLLSLTIAVVSSL